MVATPQPQRMTVATYLEWELRQDMRYEFVHGDVLAMTGGSLAHNDIAINILTALRPQVRAAGCRINIADAKVQVTPSIYRYPDLVVSCDPQDQQ
ncbi:MAG: Uma2 family endonuclease, partial [Cyanobacteria bacterium]|nr:Uma2 family endonuclease [Cyanobacteriota bacterium]